MANEIFFTYVYYIQVCTYNTNFVYISYIKKKYIIKLNMAIMFLHKLVKIGWKGNILTYNK